MVVAVVVVVRGLDEEEDDDDDDDNHDDDDDVISLADIKFYCPRRLGPQVELGEFNYSSLATFARLM